MERIVKVYILVFLFPILLFSQNISKETFIVPIGEPKVDNDTLSISSTKFESILIKPQVTAVQEVFKIVKNDLNFYKRIFNVEFSDDSAESLNIRSIRYQLKSEVFKKEKSIFLKITLTDHSKKIDLFAKDIELNFPLKRAFSHRISSDIYKAIKEKEGIFHSKILFVSDLGSKRRMPYKELYIMDFDGHGAKRLTNHKGIVLSPAISNNGKKVLYSLIKSGISKNKNINLFELDLETNKTRLISSIPGINSGAVYSHDDKSIFLTLSHTGNAEIYEINLNTLKRRRVTKHYAPDVDPSVTQDGTLMTFLSGRPGKAMIYVMDPRGQEKDVTRISYVGRYNATPRFDPTGKIIAFSSWIENSFDIFTIRPNGTGLSRLTKGFGSNEDPSFSPDGQFLIFSSQKVISKRKAVSNLYIMDLEGEIVLKLTSKLGNCITPRWSK